MHTPKDFFLVFTGEFKPRDVHTCVKHLNDLVSIIGFRTHGNNDVGAALVGNHNRLLLSRLGLLARFVHHFGHHIFDRC